VSHDRWEKVVELFEQALERPADERARFVDDSVQGDAALRDEVLAMLRAEDSVHPLFDMSPDRLADAVRERTAPSTALGWRRPGLMIVAAVVLVAAVFAVRAMRTSANAPTSIAVLPFVNMTADSTNEYFSDRVTEEITGALAQLGRVRVTPRTTAFAYKGRTGDIRQIGKELAVTRILEGSVRRDHRRVIVAVSLYDATNGERLWSNRYERDWGTVLALQTEIARTIAEQLRLVLAPGPRRASTQR
jgi:TolB-like protein